MIHLFPQHIAAERLQCARHSANEWRWNNEYSGCRMLSAMIDVHVRCYESSKIQYHGPSSHTLSHYLTTILEVDMIITPTVQVRKWKSWRRNILPMVSRLVHGRTWTWLIPNPCFQFWSGCFLEDTLRLSSVKNGEKAFQAEGTTRSQARVIVCLRNPIWIIMAENGLIKRAVCRGQSWGVPTFRGKGEKPEGIWAGVT